MEGEDHSGRQLLPHTTGECSSPWTFREKPLPASSEMAFLSSTESIFQNLFPNKIFHFSFL